MDTSGSLIACNGGGCSCCINNDDDRCGAQSRNNNVFGYGGDVSNPGMAYGGSSPGPGWGGRYVDINSLYSRTHYPFV